MKYEHGGDIYTNKGMTDYSVNINPFGPGRGVIEAVREAAGLIEQYPDSRCLKLRGVLAKKLCVPDEFLIFGNGAADLIFSIVYAQKPKKAILTAPAFSEYEQALRAVNCDITYYFLKEEKEFSLDEGYLELLTKDTDMIFLCCPDNPSGQVVEKRLLKKILQKCQNYQIRMVLDECFYEFLEYPEATVMIEEALWEKQLVLLRAFTKMYGMPGLRLGYAISCDDMLREKIATIRQPWSVSVLAQQAGVAALKEAEHVLRTRKFITRERKWMEQELMRIGVCFYKSKANYILLRSSYDLYNRLKNKGFLIRDCSNYKGLTKGYYRIAIRQREDNVRLMQAIEDIHGKDGGEENGC